MLYSWLTRIKTWWQHGCCVQQAQAPATTPALPTVEHIILTDGVARILFEDYQKHRKSTRGDEEIGWLLLGIREGNKLFALATLPAGTQREAGVAHIRFNSEAQALASRILRQKDKRLTIVGVVHTHPGSLRHPSDGDYQGDRIWVSKLRGREGVFGIGTADARAEEAESTSQPHRQCLGQLCFSWYALAEGDVQYRPLPVQVAIGNDLAQSLHRVWGVLEEHAQPLNRLCRQLAHVRFEVIDEAKVSLLSVAIQLAQPGHELRILLDDQDARYYIYREGEMIAVQPRESPVDRAIYLILAELAREPLDRCEARALVES